MAQILYTRDLAEKRDELKEQVLAAFIEQFPHYEEMTDSYEDILFEEEELESWKEDWYNEIEQIEEIDRIEDEVGSEFSYGESLIPETEWEEYVEDLCIDCGYISKDFPSFIEIDWAATAQNVSEDYCMVTYQGEEYYCRAI